MNTNAKEQNGSKGVSQQCVASYIVYYLSDHERKTGCQSKILKEMNVLVASEKKFCKR